MIETVAVLVGFLALVAVAFGGSVRLGMLVGRRLDRALEARAAAMDTKQEASGRAGIAPDDAETIAIRGREEYRGE